VDARKAARLLGVPEQRLHFMNQRDGRLLLEHTRRDHATEALARLARREKIRRVFVSWRHDPHPDHLAAAMIAERLRRRLPHIDVLEYPIWGLLLPRDVAIKDGPWTALRLDVTEHLPLKRRALLCYRTQTTAMIGDSPFAMRLQVDQLDALLTRSEMFLHRRL
jgi:LmbE family N-acetylglucosaminyl deacetylase